MALDTRGQVLILFINNGPQYWSPFHSCVALVLSIDFVHQFLYFHPFQFQFQVLIRS